MNLHISCDSTQVLITALYNDIDSFFVDLTGGGEALISGTITNEQAFFLHVMI